MKLAVLLQPPLQFIQSKSFFFRFASNIQPCRIARRLMLGNKNPINRSKTFKNYETTDITCDWDELTLLGMPQGSP